MARSRIAGYIFEGSPIFNTGYDGRNISFAIPVDTEGSVIEELKNASQLETLNDVDEITGTYPLFEWTGIVKVSSKGHTAFIISWTTTTVNEMDSLKQMVNDLEDKNKELMEENTMLTEAILELADIIGTEENE